MSTVNITVDVVNPRSMRDHTAVAIVDALTANPHGVLSRDIRAAIRAAGLPTYRMAEALHGLRNVGFDIVCIGGRDRAVYKLGASQYEHGIYDARLYSAEFVTAVRRCREYATVVQTHPGAAAALAVWEEEARRLGFLAHGLTMAEVVAVIRQVPPAPAPATATNGATAP